MRLAVSLLRRLLSRALILVAIGTCSASAEPERLRGVALVIGQSHYASLSPLDNPANDARDIQKLLGDLGFEVKLVADRDTSRLKRDIERFIEDAEDADVAFLYYAGHGIEIGGENYLVPTDADDSALSATAGRLVPLSPLMDALNHKVPLSIVLLDACRTNPFPRAAAARTGGDADAAISEIGLAAWRGAVRVAAGKKDQDGAGAVIGFAAEPGKAALDGPVGGNSPYAAALLRHLGAVGFDFGDVMTMVAEEVYLKTDGRQQPWVNTGLRQFLYFGSTGEPEEADQELISGERRKLLLTVAATPVDVRRLVEAAANSETVPLGTLYGLLAALGTDVPKDPMELDRLLRSQTERLKMLMAEREALKSTDAELVRLSRLAEDAVADGAVNASIAFRNQAKARALQLSKSVDQAEADVQARRIEFAEVYARSADTYLLAFDPLKAAQDYRLAFDQISRWDASLAWRYKLAEANALRAYGDDRGDNAVLQQALKTFSDAAQLLPKDGLSVAWAQTQNDFGLAVMTLGARDSELQTLQSAVGIFRSIVDTDIKKIDQTIWASAQSNLGTALATLGSRKAGGEEYEEAAQAFRAVRSSLDRRDQPLKWALALKGEADALAWIGLRTNEPEKLHSAVDTYEQVLLTLTRDLDPFSWAATQDSLGNALWAIGNRLDGKDYLERARDAYLAALEENTRERMPLRWAAGQSNLGNALSSIGLRDSGTDNLERAVDCYRNALQEWSREANGYSWATAQNNLGRTLVALGQRTGSEADVGAGLAAYDDALKEWTPETAALQWAGLQASVGEALLILGRDKAHLPMVRDARKAMEKAQKFYRQAGYSQYDSFFQERLDEIDEELRKLE